MEVTTMRTRTMIADSCGVNYWKIISKVRCLRCPWFRQQTLLLFYTIIVLEVLNASLISKVLHSTSKQSPLSQHMSSTYENHEIETSETSGESKMIQCFSSFPCIWKLCEDVRHTRWIFIHSGPSGCKILVAALALQFCVGGSLPPPQLLKSCQSQQLSRFQLSNSIQPYST